MALKVLITTLELESYSGLPLYTRDVALELKRQGHLPIIYTLHMGKIAEELIHADILVTDNPANINVQPDIIHGQHRVSTLIAVKQFRQAPALFIVHNHTFWGDEAPLHPRICQYFGVSRVCMDRLLKDGIPEEKISFLSNFVDIARFLPRSPLPSKPGKALIFSNYASEQTHLPAIREACHQISLDLDVVGLQAKYLYRPEEILGKYDLVFAKAKAAIEAMAVGAAVILCDFSGVGPMVTIKEFDQLRLMNFGFQALTQPLHPQNIIRQIERYDPEDAENVKRLIRSTANLENAVKNLVQNYQTIIQRYKKRLYGSSVLKPSGQESFYWERARYWAVLGAKQNKFLNTIAELDSASKESTFMHERIPVKIRSKIEFLAYKKILDHVKMLPVKIRSKFEFLAYKKILNHIKMLPLKLWLKIPEPLRVRIKKLPYFHPLIKWVKTSLGIE